MFINCFINAKYGDLHKTLLLNMVRKIIFVKWNQYYLTDTNGCETASRMCL